MSYYWISVDDYTPKAFESVLLYMPGEKPLQTVREGHYANENWYFSSNKLDKGYVTHWMPMPDGPNIDK